VNLEKAVESAPTPFALSPLKGGRGWLWCWGLAAGRFWG